MSISKCIVYGKVRGAPRPRVTRNGRHVFMPSDYTAYKQQIAADYVAQGGRHYGSSEIALDLSVFRALPKSRPKKVEAEPDTFKPDIDNIAKTFLDALNGVAFDDDAQVVRLNVVKWARRRCDEQVIVTVRPLEAE